MNRWVRRRDGSRRGLRPLLETFEPRCLPATFMVTRGDDSGPGSLRQALLDANATPNSPGDIDRIAFAIPGLNPRRIELVVPLPRIADPVVIDGWSQGGSGYEGTPLIELAYVGQALGGGFVVDSDGAGSTIQGLSIGGFLGSGIELPGGGNTIRGNFIGVAADGLTARPNAGDGIFITSGLNQIGGTRPADRNVISANVGETGSNGVGITVNGSYREAGAPFNTIQGNHIGTDASGTRALPNTLFGVILVGTTGSSISNTTIGGPEAGAGNLISGNSGAGVLVDLTEPDDSDLFGVIQGNRIGTQVDGRSPLGNDGEGIFVVRGKSLAIGGFEPGTGNVIAHNLVGVVVGGPSPGGGPAPRNILISGNSMFRNRRSFAGIDLDNDDRTPNDADDSDDGPNTLQNTPVLTAASSTSSTLVSGQLRSRPNRTYRVEVFATEDRDGSGLAEGQYPLGAVTLTTDATGFGGFSLTLAALPGGTAITATATQVAVVGADNSDANNTSEFSDAIEVVGNGSGGITDVALGGAASTQRVRVGQTLTYTLTVSNRGSATARNVEVRDSLAPNTFFIGATSSQGSAFQSQGQVIASLGDIPSGGSATVTVRVNPTAVGTATNTAQVTSTGDVVPGNNQSVITTEVIPSAPPTDLAVLSAQSEPDPALVGDLVTYTFVVANRGPNAGPSARVVVPLPTAVDFVSAQSTAGTTSMAGGVVSAQLGDLAAGAQATVTVVGRVFRNGAVSATATITSDAPDTNSGNDTATAANGGPQADLFVENAHVSASPVALGQDVSFSFLARNDGPLEATNVRYAFNVPANTTLVSAPPASLGTLAVGEARPITIVVRPFARGDMTIALALSGDQNDPRPADNVATLTAVAGVAGDTGIFSVVKKSDSVSEAATFVRVEIERKGGDYGEVTLSYTTQGGGSNGATDGADFTGRQGSLTFQAGERLRSVDIPIRQDVLAEISEEFRLILLTASNDALINSNLQNTVISILDDDSTDTDGDGLADSWEVGGMDVNGDGIIDLLLNSDPRHKDVFVEIDAMAGRAPSASDLQPVVNAFAAAPNALVRNPDGQNGVTLRLVFDDLALPWRSWVVPGADGWPSGFDTLKQASFGTAAERASPNAANILAARRMVYRYCIFAEQFNAKGSSGKAEMSGNDFMVALGKFSPAGGSPAQRAGTFMHELGHTLGLGHGGPVSRGIPIANQNYKPNYHSVMNYIYQFNPNALDYSRSRLPDLDENALDETRGIGGSPGFTTRIGPTPGRNAFEGGPLDWNGDGDTDDRRVAADINWLDSSDPASPGEVLLGAEDWSQLVYNFRNSSDYADGIHVETPDEEADESVYRLMKPSFNQAPTPWDSQGVVSAQTVSGGTTTLDVSALLDMVVDPDGDPLHLTRISAPAHGQARIEREGAVDRGLVYQADAGFVGTETLMATLSDGYGGEVSVPISITVAASTPALNRVVGWYRLGMLRQPTRLVIVHGTPWEAAEAIDQARYLVTTAGRDRRNGTSDDIPVPLLAVNLNADRTSVILRLARLVPVHSRYLITILDPNGRPVASLPFDGRRFRPATQRARPLDQTRSGAAHDATRAPIARSRTTSLIGSPR